MKRYQLMNTVVKEEHTSFLENMSLHKMKFNMHQLYDLLSQYEEANYCISTNVGLENENYHVIKQLLRTKGQFLTNKNILIKEMNYKGIVLPNLEIILPLRDLKCDDFRVFIRCACDE